MSNATIIGRETMLSRLVIFHTARFERNGMAYKKDEYINWLKSLSTRKLSTQYDETFAIAEENYTSCENDDAYTEMLKQQNSNIKYSSALMG